MVVAAQKVTHRRWPGNCRKGPCGLQWHLRLSALCTVNSLSCPIPCSLIAFGKSGMFMCVFVV